MRLPDWEARLSAYLAGAAGRSLVYGEWDCALFGAGAVEAVTGVDHGAPFRGRYTTELGAAKALRTIGAGSLEATFDRHLDAIPLAFAGRGDLVMADSNIGVCIGGEALFVRHESQGSGLVRRPRREWSKAWRV